MSDDVVLAANVILKQISEGKTELIKEIVELRAEVETLKTWFMFQMGGMVFLAAIDILHFWKS